MPTSIRTPFPCAYPYAPSNHSDPLVCDQTWADYDVTEYASMRTASLALSTCCLVFVLLDLCGVIQLSVDHSRRRGQRVYFCVKLAEASFKTQSKMTLCTMLAVNVIRSADIRGTGGRVPAVLSLILDEVSIVLGVITAALLVLSVSTAIARTQKILGIRGGCEPRTTVNAMLLIPMLLLFGALAAYEIAAGVSGVSLFMARYILLAVFALFTAINGTLGTGPVWRRLLCVSPVTPIPAPSSSSRSLLSTLTVATAGRPHVSSVPPLAVLRTPSFRTGSSNGTARSNSQCSSSMLIFSDGHEGVGVIGSACSPLPVGPDVLAANESTRSLIDTPHTTDASDRQLITRRTDSSRSGDASHSGNLSIQNELEPAAGTLATPSANMTSSQQSKPSDSVGAASPVRPGASFQASVSAIDNAEPSNMCNSSLSSHSDLVSQSLNHSMCAATPFASSIDCAGHDRGMTCVQNAPDNAQGLPLEASPVFLSSHPVPAGDASKSSDNSQGDQLRTTTSSRRMLPSEVPSSSSVSTSVNLLSQFRSSSFRESHASANLRNRLGVNEPVVRIMLYALFFNSLLIIMGTLLCCYAYAHSLDSHSPILTIAYERPFLMFMNPPATCATIFVLPLIFVWISTSCSRAAYTMVALRRCTCQLRLVSRWKHGRRMNANERAAAEEQPSSARVAISVNVSQDASPAPVFHAVVLSTSNHVIPQIASVTACVPPQPAEKLAMLVRGPSEAKVPTALRNAAIRGIKGAAVVVVSDSLTTIAEAAGGQEEDGGDEEWEGSGITEGTQRHWPVSVAKLEHTSHSLDQRVITDT